MDNRFYYQPGGNEFLLLRTGGSLRFNAGQVATLVVDISEHIREVVPLRGNRSRITEVRSQDPQAILLEAVDPDVEDALESALTRAIEIAVRRLQVGPQDRLGATIDGFTTDGLRYQIHVPLQIGLTAERMMDVIRNKLNSSESLQARLRITFKKIGVAQPNVNVLEARGKWVPQFNVFCNGKRSVIVINPPGDPERDAGDCFNQFIVFGLAHLAQQREIQNRFPTFLDLKPDLYTKLVRNYSLRHELGRDLQTWLAPDGTNADIVERVQEIFDVQIVLHDFSKKFIRSFPPPDRFPRMDQRRPLIIGLAAYDKGTPHVNFVVDIAAFNCGEDTLNYCPHCFTHYKKKRNCPNAECKGMTYCGFCHECVGVCGTCLSASCGSLDFGEEGDPVQHESRCNLCLRRFLTTTCAQLHTRDICEQLQSQRCKNCSRVKHSGACDMTRCMICGERVHLSELESDIHQCYLRRTKLKEPKHNYWTFDFECYIRNKEDGDGVHEIYLATAWAMYSSPNMQSLCNDYRHVRVPGYDNPVFIFWGRKGTDFFHFLNDARMHDTTFFAHNSGKYDGILLEMGMYKLFGYLPDKISRGCKIMSMTFQEINVTIQDSLCFIPTALRAMSKNFGIDELKKGYFPHRLLTADYFDEAEQTQFIVPTPDRSWFQEDIRLGESEEREEAALNQFLDQFYAENPENWNLKADAEAYCVSDTLLLGCVLKIFRENTMSLTNSIERHPEVKFAEFDCLQYITLPSAVMAFYKAQILPENTFAAINRYACLMRREAAMFVLYWREQMKLMEPIEWRPYVGGIQVSAKIGNQLFWFLSCYDHGCPVCYSSAYRNIRLNLPMYACHARLMSQLCELERSGCEVNIMWEHRWKERKSMIQTEQFRNKYEDWIPLDPRDAYKGGCTEMYKLVVPTAFSISDFVSQYPTMMYGTSIHPVTREVLEWPMPVGQPSLRMFPPLSVLDVPEQVGIIKCRVVPPPQLYAPFLGHKVPSLIASGSYEILYGLCRICMEKRLLGSCPHTDEERSFVGTWTIREIYYAKSLGYRVTHITELWTYERSDTQLFRGFIAPFIKAKSLAKREGIVTNEGHFTPVGVELARYLQEIMGSPVTPDDFQDTPALRTIAKLIMNSFYGKWGQRAVWPQSSRFYDDEDGQDAFHKLMIRADTEIEDVDLYCVEQGEESKTILTVQFTQTYAASFGDAKKQDHIAAYITAYGRQLLHMMVHHIGTDVINTDTDSVAHLYRDPLPYTPGNRLGDFELEVPRGEGWCGGGRKMYIYSLPNGKTVVKQKGVSLKASMKHVFTRQNMEKLVRDTIAMYDEVTQGVDSVAEASKLWRKVENRPALVVEQTRFNVVQNAAKIGYIETRKRDKATRFLREALKRQIVPRTLEDGVQIVDTLPFGYVGSF